MQGGRPGWQRCGTPVPGSTQRVCTACSKPYTRPRLGGMDIGLSLSRSIIEAHHGRLPRGSMAFIDHRLAAMLRASLVED
jgi:hypothetical protein